MRSPCLINWKLGLEVFSVSEFLYAKMKPGLRLITTSLSFHMARDKPIITLGFFYCSLHTQRIALRYVHHKSRLDINSFFPWSTTF